MQEDGVGSAKLGVEKVWLAFIAFAVVLTFVMPEDLYDRSAAVSSFVDWMARYISSVNEFAAASKFPGTTRVVLPVLWALVPPVAIFMWAYPGLIRWNEAGLRRAGILRLAVLALVVAFAVVLPNIVTITAYTMESSMAVDRLLRLVISSRLVFGVVSGAYCALTAFLLACVPRLLDPRFFFKNSATGRV